MGLSAAEYALHSLCIGRPTFLSAGRASADVKQREIWRSDAYKGSLRSHGMGAKAVLDMLTDGNAQPASHPGQKTVWDNNS